MVPCRQPGSAQSQLPTGCHASLQHQRRRQRFAQGRFAVPCAIAALGERLARGVDADSDYIVADADIELEEGARLAEPVLVIRAPEALDYGALDDLLHIRRTHQRGLYALGAHGKARVAGQKRFPFKRLDALNSSSKVPSLELAHAQIDAVGSCAARGWPERRSQSRLRTSRRPHP